MVTEGGASIGVDLELVFCSWILQDSIKKESLKINTNAETNYIFNLNDT